MSNQDAFSQKVNKEIEKQALKSGKVIAEQKVQEKLGELDSKTEHHLEDLREKLTSGIAKSGLPLLSSVYFLIAIEQLPVLFLMVLIYFFSTIISILLVLVVVIVAIIYLVAYFIIAKFPNMLKGSLGFFFAVTLSICEAIFLAYLCQVISVNWIIIIVSILLVILIVVTLLSKCMKNKYKVLVGIVTGFSISTGLYAVFILLIGGDWVTLVISYVLSNAYQCFLIYIVHRILKNIEIEEENFTIAVFVTLIVYKKKIDYTLGLVFLLGKACMKICKSKENY